MLEDQKIQRYFSSLFFCQLYEISLLSSVGNPFKKERMQQLGLVSTCLSMHWNPAVMPL